MSHIRIFRAGVVEGRETLWLKTKAVFKHAYKHLLNSADWFFKADDDTYVIVENLKYMLSRYNTSQPIYLGRRVRNYAVNTQGTKMFVKTNSFSILYCLVFL